MHWATWNVERKGSRRITGLVLAERKIMDPPFAIPCVTTGSVLHAEQHADPLKIWATVTHSA